ncbi:hypothetical protein MXB_1766, partial [Myxobolus squamalis]
NAKKIENNSRNVNFKHFMQNKQLNTCSIQCRTNAEENVKLKNDISSYMSNMDNFGNIKAQNDRNLSKIKRLNEINLTLTQNMFNAKILILATNLKRNQNHIKFFEITSKEILLKQDKL